MSRAKKMGERIKQLRERAGLSQQALAVAVHVSVSQVSRWERNLQEPSIESARALARALDVTWNELMGEP